MWRVEMSWAAERSGGGRHLVSVVAALVLAQRGALVDGLRGAGGVLLHLRQRLCQVRVPEPAPQRARTFTGSAGGRRNLCILSDAIL